MVEKDCGFGLVEDYVHRKSVVGDIAGYRCSAAFEAGLRRSPQMQTMLVL